MFLLVGLKRKHHWPHLIRFDSGLSAGLYVTSHHTIMHHAIELVLCSVVNKHAVCVHLSRGWHLCSAEDRLLLNVRSET